MLQHKSDAFEAFKKFKALAETQKGVNLKALRTDRGGEFTSTKFSNYCINNGIKKELTAPYSPQQNGMAERKNRTVLSMVRAIDVSFSCVVKTQRRWSNKIYKTELTKTRYNNQVLGKYRVDLQRAGLTLIAELTWSKLGLKGVLNKRK